MNSEKNTGILTAHNLISCIEEISLQDYDDFTHCTQIATQSADMVGGRFGDSARWLDEYVKTLNFLGWSVFQDAIFTRSQHSVSKSIAEFLVQSAQTMPDSRQGNAMIDTLDALRPNQPALYSLDQQSSLGERFQVIPTRYDSKGFFEIAVFNLELVTTIKKSGFLFFDTQDHTAEIIQRRAYLKLDKNILESKRPLMERKRLDIRMKRFDLKKNH